MINIAIAVVAMHAAWLLFVIFGVLWTRGRPFWSIVHVAALVWGIIVEVGPWPCPLTMAESVFETRAGAAAYRSASLLHFLDNLVYPNLPGWILTCAGVAVCALNLAIYIRRFWKALHQRRAKKRI
jgi:hypothetical protein